MPTSPRRKQSVYDALGRIHSLYRRADVGIGPYGPEGNKEDADFLRPLDFYSFSITARILATVLS